MLQTKNLILLVWNENLMQNLPQKKKPRTLSHVGASFNKSLIKCENFMTLKLSKEKKEPVQLVE
jgi:hypothetical protein